PINYVKAFKAVIQQAPDFGVDKTIVGIFLRNAFPTAMFDSVMPELKLTEDDDSLSTAVKKVGEELKDLRAAKRCYDVYGLEAFGLSDVSKDSSVASVDILEGLPTLV
ncbi:hypothetical protein ADUPG1_005112, partial [Aduncisulcus paluster]